MGRCGKVFSSGYQESREVWALAHVGIDASLTNYLRDLDHKQLKQGIRQSHFRDSFARICYILVQQSQNRC